MLFESGYFYTRFFEGFHGFLRLLLLNSRFFLRFSPFISVSGNPLVRTSPYTDYFAYVPRVVLTDDG
jgi:hypothetical protein